MSILIVRHGQTEDNAKGIIQVPTSPLSATGHRQAECLAQHLAKRPIARILCSDYDRAMATAGYLAKLTATTIEPVATLRERHFGDLSGLPYTGLDIDPLDHDYLPPNGESLGDFYTRVRLAWQQILSVAEVTNGDLVVVTHGFVCEALLVNHLTLPAHLQAPSKWLNTSVTDVEHSAPWLVNRLNCTQHLDQLDDSLS